MRAVVLQVAVIVVDFSLRTKIEPFETEYNVKSAV
jgi:hypothetical protein